MVNSCFPACSLPSTQSSARQSAKDGRQRSIASNSSRRSPSRANGSNQPLGHQDSVRTSLRNWRCVGGSGVCSRQRHRAVCGSSPGVLFGQNANRSCRLVWRRPGRASTARGRPSMRMEDDRQAFGEEVGIVQVSDCTAAVLPECRWQARMSGRGFQFRRGLQARLHHAFPVRRCGNRQRLRPGR